MKPKSSYGWVVLVCCAVLFVVGLARLFSGRKAESTMQKLPVQVAAKSTLPDETIKESTNEESPLVTMDPAPQELDQKTDRIGQIDQLLFAKFEGPPILELGHREAGRIAAGIDRFVAVALGEVGRERAAIAEPVDFLGVGEAVVHEDTVLFYAVKYT